MDAFINNLTPEQKKELLKSLELSAPAHKTITVPAPSALQVGRTLEDLDEWFQEMHQHTNSQGFSDEDPNIIYLYEQNFSPELQTQWRTFKRASKTSGENQGFTLVTLQQWLQRFCLPNLRIEDHLRNLIQTRQGRFSVADYITRFHEAVTSLPSLSTELVVAFFLVGLNEDIQQEMRKEEPADLQATTATALRIERQLAKPQAKSGFNQKDVYNKGTHLRCSLCQRFGHDHFTCRKLLNKPVMNRTPQGQLPPPPPPPPFSSKQTDRSLNF